jgi:hypothetical protein
VHRDFTSAVSFLAEIAALADGTCYMALTATRMRKHPYNLWRL